jgi:hypothetical protein
MWLSTTWCDFSVSPLWHGDVVTFPRLWLKYGVCITIYAESFIPSTSPGYKTCTYTSIPWSSRIYFSSTAVRSIFVHGTSDWNQSCDSGTWCWLKISRDTYLGEVFSMEWSNFRAHIFDPYPFVLMFSNQTYSGAQSSLLPRSKRLGAESRNMSDCGSAWQTIDFVSVQCAKKTSCQGQIL